jgi:SNF2 family DNA or RNA helicase
MDLPKKIYTPIYTEMNSEQKKLYQELRNEMHTEYKETELTVTHKLTLATRFQQIVGGFFPETGEPIGKKNPKIERLLYDLEDIDCDAPIIIWARFTIEIKEIAKRLTKEFKHATVETFFGETTKSARKDIMERFKKGEIDYFVANASVAGTGLNLQKAYIQYYYSSSHMAEDRWQSEDRTHRGGQEHDCLYKDIIIRGTVDDDIYKANQLKINMAEYFKTRSL